MTSEAERRARRREARESAEEALRMVAAAMPAKRRTLLQWLKLTRGKGQTMPAVVR